MPPATRAAAIARICASGRLFMIKGDGRYLRRVERALAAYAGVEVSLHPGLLMAWPAGRGGEMLEIGVRV